MRENELAAQLQAEKDDLSQWEEVSAPTKPGKRKLSAMISVRLSPDELERVQALAEESGQSVSAYLRSLALRDAAKDATRWTGKSQFVHIKVGQYASLVTVNRAYKRSLHRPYSPARTTSSAG